MILRRLNQVDVAVDNQTPIGMLMGHQIASMDVPRTPPSKCLESAVVACLMSTEMLMGHQIATMAARTIQIKPRLVFVAAERRI